VLNRTPHASRGVDTRPRLRRTIGGLGFFCLALGSMIGIGWITAMGGWLSDAGPVGAIIAFAGGGAVMALIGLCYAELTPMLPLAGGEIAYAYKASGTGTAFLVGWSLGFGYLSVSAFEAVSIGLVLSYLFPSIDVQPLYEVGGSIVYASHLGLALLCTALIAAVNFVGVHWAARIQIWLTAGLVLASGVVISAGLWRGEVAYLTPPFAAAETAAVLKGIAAVFVTAPFWFVGFDTIAQAAEEAETDFPPRRLGTIILVSIGAAAMFYGLLILSVAMLGPWAAIVGTRLPTAEAFATAFGSQTLVNVILVAALLGLITSWNGFFLAASRVLFALGRGRMVAPWLGAIHPRFGTPSNAVLLAALVTVVGASLGRGAMSSFVNAGSFCIGLAFLGVARSTIRLRRTHPDLARPYRIPGGLIVPWAAVLGSLFMLGAMLVPGSGASLAWPMEWLILVVVATLGGLFWWTGASVRGRTTGQARDRLVLSTDADPASIHQRFDGS
jgi:basic amino acid/polyamine antiporter, APA family